MIVFRGCPLSLPFRVQREPYYLKDKEGWGHLQNLVDIGPGEGGAGLRLHPHPRVLRGHAPRLPGVRLRALPRRPAELPVLVLDGVPALLQHIVLQVRHRVKVTRFAVLHQWLAWPIA